MIHDRTAAPRAGARRRTILLTASVGLASMLVLSEIATPATVAAATKTTKKTTKKTTTVKRKAPAPAKGASSAGSLWQPNGRPPALALNFDPNPPSSDKNNPSAKDEAQAWSFVGTDNGVFSILVVGTDARPNEKPDKTRGDSIHLFTYNPTLKRGALVGFPRDSYVQSPSGGSRKINEIMSTAGPDAFLATVNSMSGLVTKRWILTGFDGFKKMVDGVGGVNIYVSPAMNDAASGAQFASGWFQFNGAAALAYSRARKTLPNGDLDRSANQATLLKAGLARLRESTDNIRALLNWVLVIRKNAVSNVKPTEWMYLAQIARGIDPSTIDTVVLGGTPANVGGADVIKLDEANMTAIFEDLTDGVLKN